MPELTIVVSGPKASEQQARNALAASGFDVHATDHDHGLHPTATGEEIKEAQAFVTVHGDDVDAAWDAVRSLGWALRMHFETPEPAPPSLEQRVGEELAALRAEVAELRERV